MDCAEIVSLITNVLTGGAAVAGAVIAGMGLNTWRQQLKGKTEYELARRLLRAVYKVRDRISLVRNPLITGAEFETAAEEAGIELPDRVADRGVEVTRAVYQRRWGRLSEALSDLQVEALEAEVLWGEKVHERLKPLRDCIAKLNRGVSRHLRAQGDERWWQQLSSEDMEEIDSIIYEISDDPEKDTFTGEIQEAVEEAESFIRPHLKPEIEGNLLFQ